MPANLENSAVATGLKKVSFHPNPKERQCQKMFKLLCNCAHFPCYQILQARLQQHVNQELQTYKLGLEKAEDLEVKLPTFTGS